jgi:ATP/ADP translocase
MGTASPAKTIRRWLGIRKGETKLALLFFSYFFLIAAPQTIARTLRTTHFLVRMGVGALPIAYLASAVATGLVVLLHSRIQFRTSTRKLVSGSLVFFGLSGFPLQWALETEAGGRSALLSYAYWVWASVLIVALLTHFSMTVHEMFNAREAKRLMSFLGGGGILGGVLGGLLVGILSRTHLAPWLLPSACVMLFGCVFVVKSIFDLGPRQPTTDGSARLAEGAEERRPGFRDSFEAVRKSRYLSSIAGLVAVGVIVSTCIEFQFLSGADVHFTGRPEALQAFLGFFDPALTVFALFLNFLVGSYVLKKLDMGRTLLLTPAAILAASLVVLATPFGLLPGMLVRGADEGLAFAVTQPVREILYIPIVARLRHKAKPFIDMFVSQFARVAGALVLYVFAAVMHTQISWLTPVFNPKLAKGLSWVVIVFLVLWAALGRGIGREYVATLKRNFRPLWPRAEKDVADKLDVEHAKLVFDTIDSRNWSSVLYALHLFDLLAQDKLSPDIREMLAEKSGEVRAAALADRFTAEEAAPFLEFAQEFPPEEILSEIPLILSSNEYQRVMASYVDQLRAGGPDSEVKKMELAKAIGLMNPDSPLAGELAWLIDDESPQVASLALKSAARLRREADIPAIIRQLGRFSTLEDAVNALHKYGDAAVSALEGTLADRAVEITVRRAAVEVLARIRTPRAILALTSELERGEGELDAEVIDALDRLRSEHAQVSLSAQTVRRKALALIRTYCRTYLELRAEDAGREDTDLLGRSAGPLAACFADIFKLLGLSYPHEDIRAAYQNIRKGTRHSVAHAIEWLDNALSGEVREALLPLVEDMDAEERLRRFRKILKT